MTRSGSAVPVLTGAWIGLRRAERAFTRGELGQALALAFRSRAAGLVAPTDPVISWIRRRVAGVLPDLPTETIIAAMEPVEGWLTGREADLLARAAAVAARGDGQLVEIGSYCGRSTVVQALAVQAAAPDRSARRMIAIDPHEGYEHGGGLDSYVLLKETLRRHQVEPVVDVVCRRSVDVTLPDTIGMVFIDGMHDVRSVCADRDHVRERISVHGLMAMHDYRPEFPGVVEAADVLLREGEFSVVGFTDSLLVLRREQ